MPLGVGAADAVVEDAVAADGVRVRGRAGTRTPDPAVERDHVGLSGAEASADRGRSPGPHGGARSIRLPKFFGSRSCPCRRKLPWKTTGRCRAFSPVVEAADHVALARARSRRSCCRCRRLAGEDDHDPGRAARDDPGLRRVDAEEVALDRRRLRRLEPDARVEVAGNDVGGTCGAPSDETRADFGETPRFLCRRPGPRSGEDPSCPCRSDCPGRRRTSTRRARRFPSCRCSKPGCAGRAADPPDADVQPRGIDAVTGADLVVVEPVRAEMPTKHPSIDEVLRCPRPHRTSRPGPDGEAVDREAADRHVRCDCTMQAGVQGADSPSISIFRTVSRPSPTALRVRRAARLGVAVDRDGLGDRRQQRSPARSSARRLPTMLNAIVSGARRSRWRRGSPGGASRRPESAVEVTV